MNRGLEGVVVAETVLSDADSATGKRWMRGVPLADPVTGLAMRAPSRCCGMGSPARG
jgi:hypothetical protein